MRSPFGGCSTLTTSAPSAASLPEVRAAGTRIPKSRTFTPRRGMYVVKRMFLQSVLEVSSSLLQGDRSLGARGERPASLLLLFPWDGSVDRDDDGVAIALIQVEEFGRSHCTQRVALALADV